MGRYPAVRLVFRPFGTGWDRFGTRAPSGRLGSAISHLRDLPESDTKMDDAQQFLGRLEAAVVQAARERDQPLELQDPAFKGVVASARSWC